MLQIWYNEIYLKDDPFSVYNGHLVLLKVFEHGTFQFNDTPAFHYVANSSIYDQDPPPPDINVGIIKIARGNCQMCNRLVLNTVCGLYFIYTLLQE